MKQDLMDFLNWLKANGMASSTIKQKTGYVKKFFEVYNEITKENVQEFLVSLHDKFNNGTINNYRKALVSYCDYKEINIRIPKSLKTEDKTIDYITEDQFLQDVLSAVPYYSMQPEKDRAILCMYFYTGLRKAEIISLKRSNFNMKEKFITFKRPKTNIETEMVLHPTLVYYLEQYFGIEPEMENAFNVSIGKINGIFKRMKPNFTDFNFRPLLLRHSFATIANKSEVRGITLSNMMGHKNLNSTAKYINVTREEKRNAIQKMFGKRKK